MTLTPVRILLLLMSALCAGLAGLWLDQQGRLRNVTWDVPAAKVPDVQVPASLLPAAATAAPSFASIQERPLFAPDRRPPPPPAPPPPPDPLANLQLHGIFTGTPSGVLARIDGKVRRLVLNDAVGGWTLKSVDNRQVTFAQGTQTRQFQLVYARLNTVTPPKPVSPGTVPANSAAAQPTPANAYYREQLRLRNELNAARGLPIQLE